MGNSNVRITSRSRAALAMAAAITVGGFVAVDDARAQIVETNSVQTGNWLDPATWSNGVPGASATSAGSGSPTNANVGNNHVVTIDQPGANTVKLDIGGGTGTTLGGTVNMTAGDLFVDNFDGVAGALPSIRVGFGANVPGVTGAFNLSGGTVTINGASGSGAAIGDLIVGDQLGTGTWTQTGGDTTAADEMFIGFGTGSTGTVSVSAGNFQTTGRSILVGFLGGTGTLNVSGTANVRANFDTLVGFGNGSTATLTQSGGTYEDGFFFSNFAGGPTSNVTITQTGGTRISRIAFVLGQGAGTTVMNHSGGALNMPTNNGDFVVSDGNGNTSTYNISGTATVNALHNVIIGAFGGSNGTINQTGGTITAADNARIGADGIGNWNLSAGTVNLGNIFLGDFDSSFGTMTVSGGQVNLTGNLNVGGAVASNADNVARVAPDGTNGAQGQALDANGTFVVSGTGGDINVGGNMLANPADKSPDRNDPGEENSGTLKFVTAAAGVSPIDVTLKADLDGAVIDIDDTGGFFTANPTGTLTLINAGGGFGNVYTLTPTEAAGTGEAFTLAPGDDSMYTLSIVPFGGSGESLIAKLLAAVYWDVNGTAAGAGGASPTGNWDGTTSNFNSDATGGAGGALSAVTSTATRVVFAAGTDGGGSYTVNVSGTQSAASVEVARGNVTFNGGTIATKTFTVATGATANLNSALSTTTGLTKAGPGTLTLSTANTYTGGTTVAAGTLVVAHADAINTGQALTVAAGATARVQRGLATAIDVGDVTLTPTSRIDLNDGAVVKRNGGSGAIGQAATRAASAALKSGLENGGNFDWLGNGISSTEANADNATAGSVLYGVGIVQNNLAAAGAPDGTTTDETAGNTIYTTFKGRAAGLNDTLIRYTYMGDADLDGAITGTDYSLIDAGFGATLSGWINGDFDYSGSIDGTDYALIDNAFGAQTGVLPEQFQAMVAEHAALFGQEYLDALAAVQSGVVPEPAAMGLLALAGVGLAGRRRRRRAM